MSENLVKVIRVSKDKGTSSVQVDQVRENIRQVLEQSLRVLTDDFDLVSVKLVVGENTTQYIIECEQIHVGRILGLQGKNIAALRTLLQAMVGKHGFRAVIDVPYFSVK